MSDFKIGLQLYSLRNEMEKDVEKTLKTVSEIGYRYVEFAGYFGKTALEMKEILDRYSLCAISVHQGYDVFLENEKESIDYLKTLGVKFCAIPWMDVKKLTEKDVFLKTVEEIKKVGKILKENGITLCYHNHDFEFKVLDGEYLLDHLYGEIPANLLETEFDCGWVTYAGENPADFIHKYANRTNIVHLKDFTCKKLKNGPAYKLIDSNGKAIETEINADDNCFEFRPIGQGRLDIPPIIDACSEINAEYLIVEQDECPTASPLESVKQSYEYLKGLGI